jgi:DNA-binding NtrC family response regulator
MRHFLKKKAAEELGVEPKWLDKATERYLAGLDWPGNVRQLENTCRWLTVMSPGQEIHLEDLPPELNAAAAQPAPRRALGTVQPCALGPSAAQLQGTSACWTPRCRPSSAS